MDMTAFIDLLGNLVGALVGWCQTIIEFIVDTPYLLVPALVFFVGGGTVAIVNRLVRG